MNPATRLKMTQLAESAPYKPKALMMETGMGAPEMGVDDHLKHAVHHAHASLQATRKGDHEAALKHKNAANAHLGHANAKQNAEGDPSKHQGEKMVFGVWRKVGNLSPADHQKIGDDYTKHAQRQKARIDARAMMGGVHPSEVPDEEKGHHYHEVKRALGAAKTHYAGQDPLTHTGDAAVSREGGKPKPPVTAHGQASSGGGSHAPPKKPPPSDGFNPSADRHAQFTKMYGDQKKNWKVQVPKEQGHGYETIMTHYGTYADAHAKASQHPRFHSPGTQDQRGSIEPIR